MPVFACPMMSRPASATGRVIAWMGNGLVIPMSRSESTMSSRSSKSEKWTPLTSMVWGSSVSPAVEAWATMPVGSTWMVMDVLRFGGHAGVGRRAGGQPIVKETAPWRCVVCLRDDRATNNPPILPSRGGRGSGGGV